MKFGPEAFANNRFPKIKQIPECNQCNGPKAFIVSANGLICGECWYKNAKEEKCQLNDAPIAIQE